MQPRRLPGVARAIAAATVAAVDAARATDAEIFSAAVARLATLDPAQVRLVLGAVVRSLLEDLHPDGLSGADLREALERCLRWAATWLPGTDATTLAILLTGALGVHQPDGRQQDGAEQGTDQEEDRPRALPAPAVAEHATLLIADLLAATGAALADHLDRAFTEIANAEYADS